MRTGLALAALALAIQSSACGAYAGIADGGEDATLSIKPNFIILGTIGSLDISFDPPPPWQGSDGGIGFITGFEIEGEGISQKSLTYDGKNKIQAVLFANSSAEPGRRRVTLSVGYDPMIYGQHQRYHNGTGNLWLLPPSGN